MIDTNPQDMSHNRQSYPYTFPGAEQEIEFNLLQLTLQQGQRPETYSPSTRHNPRCLVTPPRHKNKTINNALLHESHLNITPRCTEIPTLRNYRAQP